MVNKMTLSHVVQNFIFFQLGWLCCVIGGANPGYAWVGVVAVAAIVAIHLLRAIDSRNEIILLGLSMAIGTAWDSSLMAAGIMEFNHGQLYGTIVPFWLIAMWPLFATTLNVSMKWMKGKYLLASLFGAIGGPLAYLAGNRLGAVEFSSTLNAMLVIGAGWAVIMPLLVALAERFNGYREPRDTDFGLETA